MHLRQMTAGAMYVMNLVLAGMCLNAAAVEIDWVMYADPKIEVPPALKTLPSGQMELWLAALKHSEADLQYRVALEISRAHRLGVPDLRKTSDALIALVERPNLHPHVLLACVQALVVLDARRSAPSFLAHAEYGDLSVSQLIEPALTRWEFQPIRAIWLKRLADPSPTSAGQLLLAIEGLRNGRETQVSGILSKWALAPTARPEIRIAAAQSLASLPGPLFEDDARKLSVDKAPARRIDRLVAATLLSHEGSLSKESVLVELAQDPEPAVAAVAWSRILKTNPDLVVDLAEQAIRSSDGKIRHVAAQTLYIRPSIVRISQLASLLDDPLPEVRRDVRQWLEQLASQPQFSRTVREAGMTMLAGDRFRGVEQATLLLVALDHKPAAMRLLELLEFKRPEVFITAAWGLRRLAMQETLPRRFDHATRSAELFLTWPAYTPGDAELDAALCQMFQAFGQMKYPPAAALLKRFVPKIQPGIESQSRLAAIWALGHLSAANPQPDLVSMLQDRLDEEGELPPETPHAKRMAAISLGRMQAQDAIITLRRYYKSETPDTILGRACGWAVERLTSETMRAATPLKIELGGWSLMPLQ